MSDYPITVETFCATPDPQWHIFRAMYACKHRDPHPPKIDEPEAARRIIQYLLGKNDTKSHFGPCEHPVISVFSYNVPRYVLDQIRTHRTGITFDAYSMRDGFYPEAKAVLDGAAPLESLFEIAPNYDLDHLWESLKVYVRIIEETGDTEAARSMLPSCYTTSYLMTAGARTVMHIADLRIKGDVQGSTQVWAEGMLAEAAKWMPELIEWYSKNRLGRARLSP